MSAFSAKDCQYMARAIQLAKQGRFTTAPNPNVGCVIVKDGQVIGEGYHRRAGEGHAEVNAVAAAEQAGYSLEGASCYVTLEPCSHVGRTPSCASMLVEKRVAEVVVAMQDPNPQVAGRGNARLENAGITVRTGLMEQAARALNPGFLSRVERKRPWVRLKLAASLDARTALHNGESKWITSSLARQDVQRERARSHAILSSAATVLRDNASLNVRHAELGYLAQSYTEKELRQPLRIVIDRQQRLSQADRNLKIFDNPACLLVASSAWQDLPEGVQQCILQAEESQWLSLLLRKLSTDYEINDLWLEAGANLAASMLDQQLVDQLVVYQAGLLMGADAMPLTQLSGQSSMQQLTRWRCLEKRNVGPDIKSTWTPEL